jgi:hypothetical protein
MPFIAGGFLDYIEEREAEDRAHKRERDLGNFHPYYVRKVGRVFGQAPGCAIEFGRWGVFKSRGASALSPLPLSDMNSRAPDWTRLRYFMRFERACSVAYHLQQESQRAG